MVISEKSVVVSLVIDQAVPESLLTLGIHKVGDGHGVVAVGLHFHAVEDGIEVVLGADAHVLLSELLNLDIDGNGLLQSPLLACIRRDGSRGRTYKLLSEGHLLELQFV